MTETETHEPVSAPLSVWLVGLSGAGKSEVGPVLARRMGYRFVDLDDEIERLAGEGINSVFESRGEERFRELETRAAEQMSNVRRTIVATGGGWMARSDIERSAPGRVRVWLRVRPETAIDRLGKSGVDSRPMLATEPEGPKVALRGLLRTREPAYAEAEVHVETDGCSPEAVAASILRALAARSEARQSQDNG